MLGLELAVAEHPVAVARAVAGRRRGGPALIDLAGGDPFQETERQEIAALAGAIGAAVVAVLPAALDALEAAELAAAYREAGAALLVATRLDLRPPPRRRADRGDGAAARRGRQSGRAPPTACCR